MRAIHLLLLAPLVLATACKPNLGNPPSIVDGPRILAVRGAPPEAAPGAAVTYDVLAVDPTGRIASPSVTWAVCHDPKSPAQANAVATSCLTIPDDTPSPSPTFMSPLSTMVCKQFGPEPPVMEAGQPALRPQDPDVTGGFYQPVRATLAADGAAEIAFALERITCKLANAPMLAANTFNQTYVANENPTIASLTSDPDGAATTLYAAGQTMPADPGSVAAAAAVTLEVAWPAEAAESYPVWNVLTQSLDAHREALSVSWFATDGSFAHDRTGRGETETDLTTRNVWTAPAAGAGPVHLWVLLRDSRGGVDFAEASMTVTP
jgi:hypothetical protein